MTSIEVYAGFSYIEMGFKKQACVQEVLRLLLGKLGIGSLRPRGWTHASSWVSFVAGNFSETETLTHRPSPRIEETLRRTLVFFEGIPCYVQQCSFSWP